MKDTFIRLPIFATCLLCLWVAACSTATDTPMPDPPQFEEIAASFISDSLRLQGTLFLPTNKTDVRGVVFINGSGPVDCDGTYIPQPNLLPPVYLDWATRLAEEEIAVLRYDKRFISDPTVDPLTLSQQDQINDAIAAVNYLAGRAEIDATKLFVVGHSEGGNLASEVVRATGAAGLVIIAAPAFAIDELVITQLQANPANPQSLIDQVILDFQQIRNNQFPPGGNLLGAGETYWREWIALSTNATDNVLSLNKPALVVQGCNDQNFPEGTLDRNKTLWAQAADSSAFVTAKTFEEVDHFLVDIATGRTAAEVIVEIIDFLSLH